MKIIEEHRSPDGLFRFIVEHSSDGDLSLGFESFPSHTHGDILASISGLPIKTAIRDYIDALLSNRSIIVIVRVAGKIRDVWVTENLDADKYALQNETREFRYWDGRPVL